MGVYTRMCFEMGVFTCMIWLGWIYTAFYWHGLVGWCLYPNFGVLWGISWYMSCGRCLYWSDVFFAGVIWIYPNFGVYV